MMLPTLWQNLQTLDPELFKVFEEFYNYLKQVDKPYFYASLSQSQTGVGNTLLLKCDIEHIDTHSEYDINTFSWNPSRLGYYAICYGMEFTGPVGGGDTERIILYEESGSSVGVAQHLAFQFNANTFAGKREGCAIFRVQKPNKRYRLGFVTGFSPGQQAAGGSAIEPDKTYWSAQFIRGPQ